MKFSKGPKGFRRFCRYGCHDHHRDRTGLRSWGAGSAAGPRTERPRHARWLVVELKRQRRLPRRVPGDADPLPSPALHDASAGSPGARRLRGLGAQRLRPLTKDDRRQTASANCQLSTALCLRPPPSALCHCPLLFPGLPQLQEGSESFAKGLKVSPGIAEMGPMQIGTEWNFIAGELGAPVGPFERKASLCTLAGHSVEWRVSPDPGRGTSALSSVPSRTSRRFSRAPRPPALSPTDRDPASSLFWRTGSSTLPPL